MIQNTPEYLAEELRNQYGITIPLDRVITYLESDPYLTPESLYLYETQNYETSMNQKDDIVTIPKGFTILDFSEEQEYFFPKESGNYIWLLKNDVQFPQPKGMIQPVFKRVIIKDVAYRVMYTGKASNLYKRLWSSHLNGKIAKSTLRKSLAALMGFHFMKYRSGNSLKDKITQYQEQQVTLWLIKNCILLYKTYVNYSATETKLINLLDPPLNIDGNPQLNNSQYVLQLSRLRSSNVKANIWERFIKFMESLFRQV